MNDVKTSAKTKKTVAFYVLLALTIGVIGGADALNAAIPLSLGAAGYTAIAILIFAIAGWCFSLAPIAITALTVLVLIPFSGLMDFTQVIEASFGNSTFAFFLGVLLLSTAFQQTNLGRLITLGLFRLFGHRPRGILLGLLLAGALLAMWVTEVASAAIIFPIALSIAQQTKNRPDHALLGKLFMLSVAWGPAFGGVATPIATGANLIAVDYLKTYAGIEISFAQWMCIGVPIMLTLLAAGWGLLAFLVRDNSPIDLETEAPPMQKREWLLLVDFLLAIVLWVFGEQLGLSSHLVALMAGIFLFLPGVDIVSWKQSISSISWDSIILICSGLVIGDLLYTYGVAEWFSNALFVPALLQNGIFLTGVYIVLTVAVLKIMFSSNTVTGIILVPIMITLASNLGLSAWGLVAPCIFSSALSFIVITSSPVNVIPYSAGYFTPADMAKYGVILTLLSSVIIAFWLAVFGVC